MVIFDRWVDVNLLNNEDFIGLYPIENISSIMTTTILKVLISFKNIVFIGNVKVSQ